ncbi:MAG: RagB/SusD family nutrient uptake outer membrane protein, partial [Bacteroidales bacterium]|nr:RagB/SusD family nutrient uptake outer membrane protein [Bacteroidales bacterium]
MKKITYILLIVLAGLSISCEKFLDAPEKSTVDNELIFSNPELTEEAIVGILQPMGNVNFRGRYLTHYGGNTDIEWFNSSTSINDRSDLCRYVNSTTNGDMNTLNNVFGEMYVGIERANICIAGIREYGQPEPGNEMGQLLGEALTYRAVYYADLAKTWGDVPARFEPMTESTIYIAKSSRDVIYKQIIADLEEAAKLVAWPNETARTTTVEHVNKAFVKGLRARVCLAAAGFSQRASGIKRSSDPDLSVNTLYPIALQECKDVIANGTAQLENTFEGLFRKNCLENTSAGGESLWEIPFADGRGRFLYTFGVKHNKPDQYTGQGQGGIFGPLPNVYYDFDAKDTRRDVTCVPYRWGDPSNNIASQELVGLNTWYFGKWRYEWMTRRVTSGNDDGLNKMYMRYAEIILMAAEIENELNGPAAAAPYL